MPGANRRFYLPNNNGTRKAQKENGGVISLLFVIGGMKSSDLLLYVGLALGGYFLYKKMGGQTPSINNLLFNDSIVKELEKKLNKGIDTPGGLLGKDSATDFSAWAQKVLGLDVERPNTGAPHLRDFDDFGFPPSTPAQNTERWLSAGYTQSDINFSASQIQAMLNLPSVSTTTNNGVVSYWLEI